jgi:lysyl-tRNA synthetase class 2
VVGPFDRLTVRDAFRRYAGVADAVDLACSSPYRFFQTYVDAVEPALARSRRPLFLTDFPRSQGALARARADDPTVVERYELFVAGIELCNGYGELTDPREQAARFSAERRRRRLAGERAQPSDPRFLAALEEGLPPCSGNALGLDRLLCLALEKPGIADVMAFSDRDR